MTTFTHYSIKPPPIEMAVAKDHLQITDSNHDADIAVKLQQASDYVTEYLAQGTDLAWTAATLPAVVQASMLHMLAYLYDDRGGDAASQQQRSRDVFREIELTLFSFRDPTVG